MQRFHFSFFVFLITLPGATLVADDLPDAKREQQIIKQVRQEMGRVYNLFQGVESRRNIKIKEIDPASGQTINTSELVVQRKEYYYKPAIQQILNFKKNQKVLPPDQAKKLPEKKPPIPVFDQAGIKHYNLKISALKKIGQHHCYAIQIKPLQNTKRHIRGTLFVRKDNLKPVLMQGGMADLPPGVQSLFFRVNLMQKGKWVVAGSGVSYLKVYVPLLQPERKLEIRFQASAHRMIAR